MWQLDADLAEIIGENISSRGEQGVERRRLVRWNGLASRRQPYI